MDRIVIIGAGIGGVQAASSLADQYCVTLINGEDETPYYRMRIEELLGSAGPESIAIHPDDWYCGKGIRLMAAILSPTSNTKASSRFSPSLSLS